MHTARYLGSSRQLWLRCWSGRPGGLAWRPQTGLGRRWRRPPIGRAGEKAADCVERVMEHKGQRHKCTNAGSDGWLWACVWAGCGCSGGCMCGRGRAGAARLSVDARPLLQIATATRSPHTCPKPPVQSVYRCTGTLILFYLFSESCTGMLQATYLSHPCPVPRNPPPPRTHERGPPTATVCWLSRYRTTTSSTSSRLQQFVSPPTHPRVTPAPLPAVRPPGRWGCHFDRVVCMTLYHFQE